MIHGPEVCKKYRILVPTQTYWIRLSISIRPMIDQWFICRSEFEKHRSKIFFFLKLHIQWITNSILSFNPSIRDINNFLYDLTAFNLCPIDDPLYLWILTILNIPCPLSQTSNCFHCLEGKFQSFAVVLIPRFSVLPSTYPCSNLTALLLPEHTFTPLCHPFCCFFWDVLLPPALSIKILLSL